MLIGNLYGTRYTSEHVSLAKPVVSQSQQNNFKSVSYNASNALRGSNPLSADTMDAINKIKFSGDNNVSNQGVLKDKAVKSLAVNYSVSVVADKNLDSLKGKVADLEGMPPAATLDYINNDGEPSKFKITSTGIILDSRRHIAFNDKAFADFMKKGAADFAGTLNVNIQIGKDKEGQSYGVLAYEYQDSAGSLQKGEIKIDPSRFQKELDGADTTGEDNIITKFNILNEVTDETNYSYEQPVFFISAETDKYAKIMEEQKKNATYLAAVYSVTG